jgi:hypothetical protein
VVPGSVRHRTISSRSSAPAGTAEACRVDDYRAPCGARRGTDVGRAAASRTTRGAAGDVAARQ